MIVIGECRPEDAGAEQDSGDDLHHDQRCVVFRFAHSPDQIGDGEDQRHRDQENFGSAHGGVHGAAILNASQRRSMP